MATVKGRQTSEQVEPRMDVHQLRDFVFDTLAEPIGELGCVERNEHDTGLSMRAGVIEIMIDDQEFELRIKPVETQ
jgi:hypothetical protein